MAFVLCLITSASPLLAQNGNSSNSHANNAIANSPISQEVIVAKHIDGTENAEKGQKQSSPTIENKTDYVALGFWVNVSLTLITLFVAIAAVQQANAANSSAQAVMRSERAWLLLEGEQIGAPILLPVEKEQQTPKRPVECSIALKNCGNTPASSIDWQFELQLGNSMEAPPSFEIYTRKPQGKRLTPFPVGQNHLGHTTAFLTPQEFISTSELQDITNGSKILWLCGIARYNDVFVQKRWFREKPEERYTLVCLRFICGQSVVNGQWVLAWIIREA